MTPALTVHCGDTEHKGPGEGAGGRQHHGLHWQDSSQCLNSKLFFLWEMLLAITQLFFHLQYQSLLLSLHQICFLGPWYSFVQILYPKIKTTPWFFPEPLPLIIVTSVTMQYFEMVSINHLCQEKVKLGRHTVLYQATPCFGCWVALGQQRGRAF